MGKMVAVVERQLFVVDGTWCGTLPPDPDPHMAAVFAQLDAGTLELWEGIDGVYRIYDSGRGHQLVVELPPGDDDEPEQTPRPDPQPQGPRTPPDREPIVSGEPSNHRDTPTRTKGW